MAKHIHIHLTRDTSRVVAKSKRGTVEEIELGGQKKYIGRARSGEKLPGTFNSIANAKRAVQNVGVENVSSGYQSPDVPWADL